MIVPWRSDVLIKKRTSIPSESIAKDCLNCKKPWNYEDIWNILRLALFVKDDVVTICLFSRHVLVLLMASISWQSWIWANITPNIVKTLMSPGVHDTPTTGVEQSDVRESPPKKMPWKLRWEGIIGNFAQMDHQVVFELTHPNVGLQHVLLFGLDRSCWMEKQGLRCQDGGGK